MDENIVTESRSLYLVKIQHTHTQKISLSDYISYVSHDVSHRRTEKNWKIKKQKQ